MVYFSDNWLGMIKWDYYWLIEELALFTELTSSGPLHQTCFSLSLALQNISSATFWAHHRPKRELVREKERDE